MKKQLAMLTVAALGAVGWSTQAYTQVPERFGALVEDNAGGYRAFASIDRATARSASYDALKQCGKDSCEVVLVFGGKGCGSFHSAGPEAAFGWAVAETVEDAQKESLRLCAAEALGNEVCSNTIAACNTQGGGEVYKVLALDDVID